MIQMDAVLRGVNLKFVKSLLSHTENLFKKGHFNVSKKFDDGTELNPVDKFEDLTTTHLVYLWIKEPSVTGDKRLVDCPDALPGLFEPCDVGQPSYFISHGEFVSV